MSDNTSANTSEVVQQTTPSTNASPADVLNGDSGTTTIPDLTAKNVGTDSPITSTDAVSANPFDDDVPRAVSVLRHVSQSESSPKADADPKENGNGEDEDDVPRAISCLRHVSPRGNSPSKQAEDDENGDDDVVRGISALRNTASGSPVKSTEKTAEEVSEELAVLESLRKIGTHERKTETIEIKSTTGADLTVKVDADGKAVPGALDLQGLLKSTGGQNKIMREFEEKNVKEKFKMNEGTDMRFMLKKTARSVGGGNSTARTDYRDLLKRKAPSPIPSTARSSRVEIPGRRRGRPESREKSGSQTERVVRPGDPSSLKDSLGDDATVKKKKKKKKKKKTGDSGADTVEADGSDVEAAGDVDESERGVGSRSTSAPDLSVTESDNGDASDDDYDEDDEEELIRRAAEEFFERQIEVKEFIEEILEEEIELVEGDLHAALKTGVVLCRLLKAVDDRSVPVIHSSKAAFKCKENIIFFLEVIAEMGIGFHKRFEVRDLYDAHNMMKVVECVEALSKHADFVQYIDDKREKKIQEEEEKLRKEEEERLRLEEEQRKRLEALADEAREEELAKARVRAKQAMQTAAKAAATRAASEQERKEKSRQEQLDRAKKMMRKDRQEKRKKKKLPKKESAVSKLTRRQRETIFLACALPVPSSAADVATLSTPDTPVSPKVSPKQKEADKEKEMPSTPRTPRSSSRSSKRSKSKKNRSKTDAPAATSPAEAETTQVQAPTVTDAARSEAEKQEALDMVNPMVTKVQALWRGYVVRKMFRRKLRSRAHREKVANEILQTEKVYVNNLRLLQLVFLTPMKENDLVPEGALKSMLSDLEVISNYSQLLLSKVIPRVEEWNDQQCLGDIFLQITGFLKVYTQYVKAYGASLAIMRTHKTSNPEFSRFLAKCEMHPEVGMKDIGAFLILPVQRIPRYEMLLRELVKHTEVDHPDHAKVQQAAVKMSEVAAYVNQKKAEAENMRIVLDIVEMFDPKDVTELAKPHRRFVHQGTIMGAKRKEKRLLLFDDVVVLARGKKKGKRWEVEASYPLYGLDAQPVAANRDFAFSLLTANGSTIVLATVRSEKERDIWVRKFTETFQTLSSKRGLQADARLKMIQDEARARGVSVPSAGGASPTQTRYVSAGRAASVDYGESNGGPGSLSLNTAVASNSSPGQFTPKKSKGWFSKRKSMRDKP
eukprot:TRINITY_DN498_c0_g1_i2.p1 TRINITY_DN498_c0_g1~~TRINITY_DN498_c0_g1_i2.p1  ORF type:complete len:1180 (-),score=399.95 TRINITY_DN498_c0_g1_i2:156-3695(-)